MTFSWRQAPDLMARLTAAQNAPANLTQDVMTFAGFCGTREALERHVIACEQRALRAAQSRKTHAYWHSMDYVGR